MIRVFILISAVAACFSTYTATLSIASPLPAHPASLLGPDSAYGGPHVTGDGTGGGGTGGG